MDTSHSVDFTGLLVHPYDKEAHTFQQYQGPYPDYLDAFIPEAGVHQFPQLLRNGCHTTEELGPGPLGFGGIVLPEHLHQTPPQARDHPPPYPAPFHSQNKPDELESACRPRLTPDQTAFLEDFYSHTPRPTTAQKRNIAMHLGLMLEKINNWFQNRRAKSKQQNRIRREYDVLDVRRTLMQPLMQQPGMGLAQAGILPQYYSSAQTDAQLDGPATASAVTTNLSHFPTLASQGPWVQATITLDAQHEQQSSMSQADSPIDEQVVPASQPIEDLVPRLGPGFGLTRWAVSATANPQDLEFHHHDSKNPQLLLQQAAMPLPSGDVAASDGSEQLSMELLNLDQMSTDIMQSFPGDLSSNQNQMNEVLQHDRSPNSNSADELLVPSLKSENGSSETSGDSVKLSISMGSAPESIFKTPTAPSQLLSLAARRKQQTPIALTPVRAASTTTQQPGSPSDKDAIYMQALRRIKSSGNPMNGIGRIQKSSGQHSPLSPLVLAGAREPGGSSATRRSLLERRADAAYARQNREGSVTSLHEDNPPTSDSPPLESSMWPMYTTSDSSPDSSFYAPALSATWTQLSFDGDGFSSPPYTPLAPPTSHWPSWADTVIPQSAPSHLTCFDDLSSPPLLGAHATTPTSILTPQPTYNEVPYFINPRGLTPQTLFPGALGPQVGVGTGCGDGGDGKSSRSQSMDDATVTNSPPPSQPPQKELEFVVQTFPAPADDGIARPKIKTPAQFTFQVSGPEDYKEHETT